MSRTIRPCQVGTLTLEAAITLTTFVLFFCAFHHEYRTLLWEAGSERGWNSAPPQQEDATSPGSDVPLIWSQSLATSNLGISMVAATICLARIALMLYELKTVAIPLFYDLLLSGLLIWSVWAQCSADMTDADHISMRPWYLVRSCNEVTDGRCFLACHMAKASFAFTIISMTFYVTRAILSIRQLACGPKERNQAGGVTVFVPRLLDNKSGARYSTFSSWREKRTSVDTYVDDDGGNNSDVEDAKGHH